VFELEQPFKDLGNAIKKASQLPAATRAPPPPAAEKAAKSVGDVQTQMQKELNGSRAEIDKLKKAKLKTAQNWTPGWKTLVLLTISVILVGVLWARERWASEVPAAEAPAAPAAEEKAPEAPAAKVARKKAEEVSHTRSLLF